MSEYQYYEFLAIDHPLSADDRAAIRRISTRAEITSTRFTNEYHFGSFKGNPLDFMKRWFDVHVYFANWGTRRLMVRLPKAAVDLDRLRAAAGGADSTQIVETEEHVILDLAVESEDYDMFVEDADWMDRLAPIRADLLAGDYRLLYLPWLYDAWMGTFDGEETEPIPGIGPITPVLDDAAQYFGLPDELVMIAAELSDPSRAAPDEAGIRAAIAGLNDEEKVDLLVRVAQGDRRVSAELQKIARQAREAPKRPKTLKPRTVSEILARFEPPEE